MRVQANTLTLDHRRVLRLGIALSVTFFVIHVATAFSTKRLGFGDLRIMDLGEDRAIPTWFASIMLLSTGAALALRWWVARRTDRAGELRWLALAGLFVAASIDEVGTVHEWIGETLNRHAGNWGGLLHYQWLAVGIPLAIAAVVSFGPFIARLDARPRGLFIVGAASFLGGAIVIEAFNGQLADDGGEQSLRYAIQTGVEELGEFIGAACFLAASIAIVESTGWRLRFEPAVADEPIDLESSSDPIRLPVTPREIEPTNLSGRS